MKQLQAESDRVETARDEAEALAERLVRDMDEAFDAGDEVEVARLQDLLLHAETALQNAEREYESSMDEIGETGKFWYVDDDDDDDDD